MKKRLINILNGIADGVSPSLRNSIKKTNDGFEVNRARLTASVLSFMVMVGMLKGWITFDQLMKFLHLVFTV